MLQFRQLTPRRWFTKVRCSCPRSMVYHVHVAFELLLRAVSVLAETNIDGELWESSFTAQLCATQSYKHQAAETGLKEWLSPIRMRPACVIS